MSRICSAAVFGLCAATGAGASGFLSGFLVAALFLEKLFAELFDDFFAALLDEFLNELFDEPLPLEAPGFLEEVARFAAFFAAFLAVRVDADFARGYLSFQSVQFNAVNVVKRGE